MLDQPARDQMSQDHMGLVRSLACKIRDQYNLRADLDEMVGNGSAGLVDAANRWDPERGVAFSTFAYYRVRGAILDGLRQQGLFRKRQLLRFAAGADAVMQERLGAGDPGRQQGGEGAAGQVASLARNLSEIAAVFVVSLDEPAQARKAADPGQPEIHEQLATARNSQLVRKALKALPERERKLVRLHYWEDLSLAEAGEKLGLSRSWACRLHARAIGRLARLIPALE